MIVYFCINAVNAAVMLDYNIKRVNFFMV